MFVTGDQRQSVLDCRRGDPDIVFRDWSACRAQGLSYSRFTEAMKAAGIELDRKVLSDIAVHDEAAFTALIQQAKKALERKPAATLKKVAA